MKPQCDVVRLDDRHPNLPWMLDTVDKLHQLFLGFSGITTPPHQFMEFVHQHLSDETMFLIIGLDNTHTPLGYGLAFDVIQHNFIPDWQRSGYITNLFTVADRRGCGIGQTMYNSIVHWLRQRGITNVLLNVDVENDQGERFWQKQGFRPYLLRMRVTLLPPSNATSTEHSGVR